MSLPSLTIPIHLRPPADGLRLLVRACWATLGDQVERRAVSGSLAFASLGLCWPTPAAWPTPADCGWDLRRYGDAVRDALVTAGVDPDALGAAAGAALGVCLGSAEDVPEAQPAEVPEPPDGAPPDVLLAYHAALRAQRTGAPEAANLAAAYRSMIAPGAP